MDSYRVTQSSYIGPVTTTVAADRFEARCQDVTFYVKDSLVAYFTDVHSVVLVYDEMVSDNAAQLRVVG